MQPNRAYLDSDFSEILETEFLNFDAFIGKQITILGGTGFIGSWLTSSLLQANKHYQLGLRLEIISRDIEKARVLLGCQQESNVKFLQWDFRFQNDRFLSESDYFINGATPSISATGSEDPELVTSSTQNSTKYIVDSAGKVNNFPRVLNLSSGAVYGKLFRFSDSEPWGRDINISNYGLAKLNSENQLRIAARNNLLQFSSPRLFAFMGPGLSLDSHFAIGNFLAAGLKGNEIIIQGNPLTERSYLYTTDLVRELLKLLITPNDSLINIGSSTPITILDLATMISKMTSSSKILQLNQSVEMTKYVPDSNLNVGTYPDNPTVDLEEGISRWIKWLRT